MCQTCYNHAKKYYPELPEADLGELLMGATAFPFCEPDYLEKQLIELRANTDGTLGQAIGYAEHKMFENLQQEDK